jgi:hypothetical protein
MPPTNSDPDGEPMSGQSPDIERIFTGQELGDALGTLPRGVLLLHDKSRPAESRDLGDRWGWGLCLIPVEAEPLAKAGLIAVARRGTGAVVLHPGGGADPARLALAFALHLDVRRRRDPDPVRPCVISRCPPHLPSGTLVRLPHLIAHRLFSGSIEDLTVWEVMAAEKALCWLGGPLPEKDKCLLIEQKLTGLLALRSQARAGQLPDTEAGRRLADRLTNRYLSIRMVYQHIDLFLNLLDGKAPGR